MLEEKDHIKINRFIQSMPPLPVSVSKIMELSRDPKVDAQKLNNIISIDPVLTGKVLKLINSAYYSLPNRITSLVRAIIMLGINTIKNLVLSTAVVSAVSDKNNFAALDMASFWRHSVLTGSMAKFFATKQGIDSKFTEEYFVAGLLHDIGKIPLNSVIPEGYKRAIEVSKDRKIPLHECETKLFEIDHTDIGGRIADLWKLNPNLKRTILYHHNIDELEGENKKFVATILLADIIANKTGMAFSGNLAPDNKLDDILSIINISQANIQEAEKNAEVFLKKSEVFLKLNS